MAPLSQLFLCLVHITSSKKIWDSAVQELWRWEWATSLLSKAVAAPGQWRLGKWLMWLKTEFSDVLNFNELKFKQPHVLVFTAVAVFIFATLPPLTFSHSSSLHCQSCPACRPPCLFLLFVENRSGSLSASPTTRVRVSLKLSWPPLLPFSRTLKAALRSLSCCRSSQRLQKPGDLSTVPTQRIVLQNCPKRNSLEGPRMVNPFLQGCWLLETSPTSRAFQTS